MTASAGQGRANGEASPAAGFACSRCGAARMVQGEIRSAFWQGDRLVVVQGIPGLVCTACGEEYVSDETAVHLDRLRARRDPDAAGARMTVPVFDYATLTGRAP